MRAVILNFTGGRENWGCQATSFNLFRFCKAALEPFGLTDLSIVPFPPGSVQDRMDRVFDGQLIRRVYSGLGSDQDLARLEQVVTRRFGYHVDRVRNADIVFFQGEGSLGPSRSYESAILLGLPYVAKSIWKKPVFSLNQTLFARTPADTAAAVHVFGSFDMVAVREESSLAWCHENGLGQAVSHPDAAFCDAFDPAIVAQGESAQYFCATGSAALEKYDLSKYAQAIAEISRALDLPVRFLSSRTREKPLVQALEKHMPSDRLTIISSRKIPNYRDLLPILRSAEFVLGGRYHTSISALAMGTPVVLTPSNSHKSEGLANLLGMDLPVVSPDDPDGLIAAAIDAFRNREELRKLIEAAHTRLARRFDEFQDVLCEAVEGLQFARTGETEPTANCIAESKVRWIRGDVPRGLRKLASQLMLSRNLAAFDIAPTT